MNRMSPFEVVTTFCATMDESYRAEDIDSVSGGLAELLDAAAGN